MTMPEKIVTAVDSTMLTPSPPTLHSRVMLTSIVIAQLSSKAPPIATTHAPAAAQLAGACSDHAPKPTAGRIAIEKTKIGKARSRTGAVRPAIARLNQRLYRSIG